MPFCSAPFKSSHRGCLLRPKSTWALVAQRLMWTFLVLPGEPLPYPMSGFVKCGEIVQPHTFLFEATEESLDDAMLLGGVRGDKLLPQAIITTSGPKAPTLNTNPLLLRTCGVVPVGRRVPKRARQAASKARSASLARLRKEKSYPITSRSWQSMTAARCIQPSCPQAMCVISIAQRSLLCAVRLCRPRARGRGVAAR